MGQEVLCGLGQGKSVPHEDSCLNARAPSPPCPGTVQRAPQPERGGSRGPALGMSAVRTRRGLTVL